VSPIVSLALRARGVVVGKNFYAEGVPVLKIDGNARNIEIGDDVKFTGTVELRNRENGKIKIGKGCKIDNGVRLVAAQNAAITLGEGTNIAPYTQLNCGADLTIGRKCLIAAFSIIQSSDHGMKKGVFIKDQPFTYGPIAIGDGVWLGSHVSVLQGVSIGAGAVIGSKAVVTSDIPADSIAVGVPAKVIKERQP
jgi:acetyltransferase-like isoleucine patch superfamily enzyme